MKPFVNHCSLINKYLEYLVLLDRIIFFHCTIIFPARIYFVFIFMKLISFLEVCIENSFVYDRSSVKFYKLSLRLLDVP